MLARSVIDRTFLSPAFCISLLSLCSSSLSRPVSPLYLPLPYPCSLSPFRPFPHGSCSALSSCLSSLSPSLPLSLSLSFFSLFLSLFSFLLSKKIFNWVCLFYHWSPAFGSLTVLIFFWLFSPSRDTLSTSRILRGVCTEMFFVVHSIKIRQIYFAGGGKVPSQRSGGHASLSLRPAGRGFCAGNPPGCW